MNFPTPKLSTLFRDNKPFNGLFSVYGDFGVGKTIFALQTIINTAKLGKTVMFIYTKKIFPSEKMNNLLEFDSLEKTSEVLNNILALQSGTFDDLRNIVVNLDFLILNNIKKKKDYSLDLIVIDSLTDLYRIELNRDKKEKNLNLNFQLNLILASLQYIGETYGTNILVVNEISRISNNEQEIEFQSGGKVMDYWIKTSLKISRTEKLNQRKIKISKHLEGTILEFTSDVTQGGFI
jgi:RecA/RadA recombinase